MGLQIDSQIFKWLQALKVAKEGKRTSDGKVELPEPVTSRLFDGVAISQIVRTLLKQKGEDEALTKLASIRQNSTPAIRLYNWNLLADSLKKLGYTMDYAEKSKLLNLESEALMKIVRHLWTLRTEENSASGNLAVSLKDVSTKTLREAANVFEFLVISICNRFKLSVQHALNLFLDNNKYLAHLFVKGVKGSYEPVIQVLGDCQQQANFIVDSLLCVDQKQSVDLLLGALKPCLISKDGAVAQSCLNFLKSLCELYLQKGLNLEVACSWMEREGFDTIFFSIKRHSHLFAESLAVAYGFLQEKIFKRLMPEDKSLLWSNQAERLAFYRQFLDQAHTSLLQKFMADPAFDQWNKLCVKSLKRARSSEQHYELLTLFEQLWARHKSSFEKSPLNLPSTYISFIRNCILSTSELVFTEATRILFTLIVELGLSKNQNAPILYKAAVSSLNMVSNSNHLDFILESFLRVMKEIPSLPAAPLAEPLLKIIDSSPSQNALSMVRVVLFEGRLRDNEREQIEQALIKIIFSDIQFSELAQRVLVDHLKQPQNGEPLEQYCSTGLAQFYSIAKEVSRPLKQIRADFQRFEQQEAMVKGQPSFLRSTRRFICLANIVLFLQKAVQVNLNVKQDLQPQIFHTYIRIERELKRQHVSRILMPLMRDYYDEHDMPEKLERYLDQVRPPVLNFESLNAQSQVASPSPTPRIKMSRQRTEQNKRTNRINSIAKDLEILKKKREEEREKSIMEERQKIAQQQKKHLYFSMINEKRIVEYGKSRQLDVDYHVLQDFNSVKPTQKPYEQPDLLILNFQSQEEKAYIEDAMAIMRKYKKLWRFLFFKFSSFGIKGASQNQHPEEKISGADIIKFIRDYNIELLTKEKALILVRRVNEAQKRKTDPGNLTYQGFEDYLLQFCFLGYRKEFPCDPPGKQVRRFIDHIRRVTASRGSSVEMFDSPEEMYFQETEVIREFNKRLSQNPEYPLPEGYKKVKQTEYRFNYTVTQMQKGIDKSRTDCVQVLDEILFDSLGFRILEPLMGLEEKCLARPALFQKIKQRIKDQHGGYLLPKKSAYLPRIQKDISPTKVEFHLPIPFSIGIKLGIAETDPKERIVAEEVAYWLDDALDAIEAGRDKVGNKSKTRVINELMRRKRSEALQFRVEKHEQEKKQRSRAVTLKHKTAQFHEDKKELDKKAREDMRAHRQKRREKEKKMFEKKKDEFQEAKNKLQAKRKEIEDKKENELKMKRKDHEQYKKNVEEYFNKKKEEIGDQQKNVKATKQQKSQIENDKKTRLQKQKRRIEIEVFKKEESVLQKLASSKQTYDQAWKQEQVQFEVQSYRMGLKLMFDLLVKYQKGKISTAGVGQIGINTFNFYMLRSRIVPLIVSKNALAILFRSMCKNQKHNGINFGQFQELLFKIAVKGKQVLNSQKHPKKEEFEMVESELPSLKSSPDMQSPKKKSLTDEYALDATGVTSLTVKRLMQYLDLPDDKPESEEKFRDLLQRTSSKPVSIAMKQAKTMLDSIVIDSTLI